MTVCPTASLLGVTFIPSILNISGVSSDHFLEFMIDISGFPKCAHILPVMPFYVPSDVPGF